MESRWRNKGNTRENLSEPQLFCVYEAVVLEIDPGRGVLVRLDTPGIAPVAGIVPPHYVSQQLYSDWRKAEWHRARAGYCCSLILPSRAVLAKEMSKVAKLKGSVAVRVVRLLPSSLRRMSALAHAGVNNVTVTFEGSMLGILEQRNKDMMKKPSLGKSVRQAIPGFASDGQQDGKKTDGTRISPKRDAGAHKSPVVCEQAEAQCPKQSMSFSSMIVASAAGNANAPDVEASGLVKDAAGKLSGGQAGAQASTLPADSTASLMLAPGGAVLRGGRDAPVAYVQPTGDVADARGLSLVEVEEGEVDLERRWRVPEEGISVPPWLGHKRNSGGSGRAPFQGGGGAALHGTSPLPGFVVPAPPAPPPPPPPPPLPPLPGSEHLGAQSCAHVASTWIPAEEGEAPPLPDEDCDEAPKEPSNYSVTPRIAGAGASLEIQDAPNSAPLLAPSVPNSGEQCAQGPALEKESTPTGLCISKASGLRSDSQATQRGFPTAVCGKPSRQADLSQAADLFQASGGNAGIWMKGARTRMSSNWQESIPCKFFNTRQGCSYGSACQFLHDRMAGLQPQVASSLTKCQQSDQIRPSSWYAGSDGPPARDLCLSVHSRPQGGGGTVACGKRGRSVQSLGQIQDERDDALEVCHRDRHGPLCSTDRLLRCKDRDYGGDRARREDGNRSRSRSRERYRVHSLEHGDRHGSYNADKGCQRDRPRLPQNRSPRSEWHNSKAEGVLGQTGVKQSLSIRRTASVSDNRNAAARLRHQVPERYRRNQGSVRSGAFLRSLGGSRAQVVDVPEVTDAEQALCDGGTMQDAHMHPGSCHVSDRVVPSDGSCQPAKDNTCFASLPVSAGNVRAMSSPRNAGMSVRFPRVAEASPSNAEPAEPCMATEAKDLAGQEACDQEAEAELGKSVETVKVEPASGTGHDTRSDESNEQTHGDQGNASPSAGSPQAGERSASKDFTEEVADSERRHKSFPNCASLQATQFRLSSTSHEQTVASRRASGDDVAASPAEAVPEPTGLQESSFLAAFGQPKTGVVLHGQVDPKGSIAEGLMVSVSGSPGDGLDVYVHWTHLSQALLKRGILADQSMRPSVLENLGQYLGGKPVACRVLYVEHVPGRRPWVEASFVHASTENPVWDRVQQEYLRQRRTWAQAVVPKALGSSPDKKADHLADTDAPRAGTHNPMAETSNLGEGSRERAGATNLVHDQQFEPAMHQQLCAISRPVWPGVVGRAAQLAFSAEALLSRQSKAKQNEAVNPGASEFADVPYDAGCLLAILDKQYEDQKHALREQLARLEQEHTFSRSSLLNMAVGPGLATPALDGSTAQRIASSMPDQPTVHIPMGVPAVHGAANNDRC